MRIEILGCSGGISSGQWTTSFLLDGDILIDAGTGVGRLDRPRMSGIRHIFITHSHLDHICSIPFLLVSVFDQIDEPIVLYGRPETLQALREHIFNWVIWPDFTILPDAENGRCRFQPMLPGEVVEIAGRRVQMLEVNHTVPAAGYLVESAAGAFAFTGDTVTNNACWLALNARSRLDILFAEVSFTNADIVLSRQSKHYCPRLLKEDLDKLRHRPQLYLSHLQVGREEEIMAECTELLAAIEPKQLLPGMIIELNAGGV